MPSFTHPDTHTYSLCYSLLLKEQRQASVVWNKLATWVDSEVTAASSNAAAPGSPLGDNLPLVLLQGTMSRDMVVTAGCGKLPASSV